MLVCRDIVLNKGEKKILKGVSATLEPGCVTALVGKNGAGKTSLLRVLSGEETGYHQGDVFVSDKNINNISSLGLSLRRAVLPQHSPLSFALSVYDVVAMGRAPHHKRGDFELSVERVVAQALEMVGLSGFELRGYEALSGGERQRVHLARVLCQLAPLDDSLQRKWLFLDEPTASQDIGHAHDMLSCVQDLSHRHGLGVCMIVHDLNFVLRYADEMVVLSQGEVLSQGTTSEILDSELLAQAFGVQAQLIEHEGERMVFIKGTF